MDRHDQQAQGCRKITCFNNEWIMQSFDIFSNKEREFQKKKNRYPAGIHVQYSIIYGRIRCAPPGIYRHHSYRSTNDLRNRAIYTGWWCVNDKKLSFIPPSRQARDLYHLKGAVHLMDTNWTYAPKFWGCRALSSARREFFPLHFFFHGASYRYN